MNQMLESKIGKIFVIIYALLTLALYVYVFSCEGNTCATYIVIPIMPWALIIVRDFGLVFPSAMYPIFILLNASVAYVLGATMEWAYNRYLDFKQAKKLKLLNQKKNNFLKT